MTPLQALLAHASPNAPFAEFARHIRNGSCPLDGDEHGQGLLAGALDAAKYNGNDASLVPLVSAMIGAGARLPPRSEPGQHIAMSQPWRSRLPMCGLLINLAREQTPLEQALDLVAVIEKLSSGHERKIAQIVGDTKDKVSELHPGHANDFWARPIQGLGTMSFLAAACMTSPPCGLHKNTLPPMPERRSKALAHFIKANPDAVATSLDDFLCQLLVDSNKRSANSLADIDPASLTWNRLAASHPDGFDGWAESICKQVADLPRLTRAQSCCAILDTLAPHARHDPRAAQMFAGLLPVATGLQRQELRSMAQDGNSLAGSIALKTIGMQMDPEDDMDGAMYIWMAMSKLETPAFDVREFAAKMMPALARARPSASLLAQALGDIEFTHDLDEHHLGALRALGDCIALQATPAPPNSTRPGARF